MCEYEKISVSGLTNEEWLKLRKSGIGGSDAGAIVGVNPYSSPLKVYKDKTSDEVEEITTEATRLGHDLESYCAQRWCEVTGKKVRRSNYMYRSKEFPWMIADVDRLVVGEDAILECKTCNAWGESKWKDGDIPLSYLMQCYHYMAVTKKTTVYLACLIMGVGFVYRTIKWNDEIINELIKSEADFWNNYVVLCKMPPVDGSKCCDEIIGKYFPRAEKGKIILLEGFDEKLSRREEILRQIENLESEQKQIEQEIKLYMGDCEIAHNKEYRISWGMVDTTRLDSKHLKQDLPEIYTKYSKTTSSRRFQIKNAS